MTHVRKQIRDAVAARVTGLSTTGSAVHKARIYSVPVPALLVYTPDEPAQLDAKGKTPSVERFLELRIEGLAGTSDETFIDILDQIASEVEIAMASDLTFGGLVKRGVLTRTQTGFAEGGEGNKTLGAIILTYEMRYRTAENNPDSTNH